MTAVALIDGELTPDSFTEGRLRNSTTLSLMKKVRVLEDEALSARYPAAAPCRLSIRLSPGSTVRTEVEYAKGHINDPMSDAELNGKFLGMSRNFGEKAQRQAILDRLWNLDRASTVDEVLKLIRYQAESSPAH